MRASSLLPPVDGCRDETLELIQECNWEVLYAKDQCGFIPFAPLIV